MNIKVYVRVRPAKPKEDEIDIKTDKSIIVANKKKYSFDAIFSKQSSQQFFYENAMSGFIDKVIEGYNCTFFAYGQTGTGKTYTMEGEENKEGVIPRVVNELFDSLEKKGLRYRMRVTHVEIYNEKVYDLLGENRKELSIRDKKDGSGAAADGATELTITRENIHQILAKSSSLRKTAATEMNPNSSRSHCIFTVIVQIIRDTELEGDFVVPGRIHCVDLAGSENSERAGVIGDKVKQREGISINQSLLTLNRVIMGVSKGDSYIPYRSSPLTRILQDALGGSSITAMVATISPSKIDFEETISTLEYAKQVRTIKNLPKQNERIRKDVFLQKKFDKIARLKRLINEGKSNDKVLTEEELEKLQQEVIKINQKNLEMQELFARAKGEVNSAKEQLQGAVNYIALKRRSEIELKTTLSKVVHVVETLMQQSRNLEEIYDHNVEQIKINKETIAILQNTTTDTFNSFSSQLNDDVVGFTTKCTQLKQDITENDSHPVTEGMCFEEYNQDSVCKEALKRMQRFEGVGFKAQNNALGVYEKMNNVTTEYQTDVLKQLGQVQKTLDDAQEQKEKEMEEIDVTLQTTNKRFDDGVERAKEFQTKRSEESKQLINHQQSEMKCLQDAIGKKFEDVQQNIHDVITTTQNGVMSTINQWNMEMDKEIGNDEQHMDEVVSDITSCTENGMEVIGGMKDFILQQQNERARQQQEILNSLQQQIKESHTLYQQFENNLRLTHGDLQNVFNDFYKESKDQITGILQTIELGIGENGIIGILKTQLDEIVGHMDKKSELTESIRKECNNLMSTLGKIKENVAVNSKQLNNSISVEFNELHQAERIDVEVPKVHINPRVSIMPVFGNRDSVKVKDFD
ncbi:Kinesin [Entamoeba marina]